MLIHKSLQNDVWIVANEEDGCNVWALSIFPHVFGQVMHRQARTKPFYCAMEFQGEHIRLLVPSRHWERQGKLIFERVLKNPKYFSGVKQKVQGNADKLYHFSEKVLKTNISLISNKQLITLFNSHTRIAEEMISWGMISTVTEIPHVLFTGYVERFLKSRIAALKLTGTYAKYFHALSALETEGTVKLRELDMLEILSKIQKQELSSRVLKTKANGLQALPPEILRRIKEHTAKFCWCEYNYNGPAFGEHKILDDLKKLVKTGVKAGHELKKHKQESAERLRKIKIAEKELKLSRKEVLLLRAFRDTLTMKIVRRDALTFSNYAMERVLIEFTRRADIKLGLAKSIVIGQHAKVLQNPKKWKAQLAKQEKHCVFVCAGKPAILTGIQAKKFIATYIKKETIDSAHELKGQIACPGHARGKVKIINVPADMAKMKKGDILVSIATIPEIVPAMKKAAAIVTEMGGITSHAAIVSRELKIPCVIGTKLATKILKDGDTVDVDANTGTVKKL